MEGVVMREEPERLREAKSKLEYLRYGDGNFTPLDSTDAEALLAEVERLAGERDERLTRESGLALIEDANRWERAYTKARDELAAAEAERERLAGERDAALTRADTWERTYWASEKQAVEERAECERLAGRVARAAHIAEHLFAMIDSQTWRDSGGDDGQGHYEGEYRAEQIQAEITALADVGGSPLSFEGFRGKEPSR